MEEEKSAWEKQLEVEKKERELFEGPQRRYYEIPEKLEPLEALWYYNTLVDRQEEIYHNFLSRLKTMEEWLEVYIESKENMPSRDLAFRKLSELEMTLDELIELNEARYHDEKITTLTNRRISEYAVNSYDRWLEVHDQSPFGSKLKIQAIKNMRTFAKSLDDWQRLYERSDIGSKNQILALQNILLLSRFEMIRRKSKKEEELELMNEISLKGPKEWRKIYEKRDFYSRESANAVVSIYLSADMKAREEALASS